MTTAGIVCEYNPFHNGHRYHIERTRALGATHIVCVMSGNFVQRGEPACFSKRARARMAVENGADLVVELPLAWAVSGAQSFAAGAVDILDAMGAADILSFGSECGDTGAVSRCAQALKDERVRGLIRSYVGELSYPSAVSRAVSEVFGSRTAACLMNPNDTLNVEYLSALSSLKSVITPLAVKREERHDGHELSAKNIRELIFNKGDISALVPQGCKKIIEDEISAGFAPCSLEYVERAVLSSLRLMTPEDIKKAPDISQGLENRIYRAVRQAGTVEELYSLIKTKRYTLAKLRRAVLCLYLGVSAGHARGLPPYIRVLAANERGREILNISGSKARLPILTRPSELNSLDERVRDTFNLECRAGDLFALCSPVVRQCGLEMTHKALFL